MLRTPFYQFHVDHDAKMVDFAGWEMPILYASIQDEHRQVRESGGLFDVSHMGRVFFTGRHARRFLESVLTRRITDMKVSTCRYSLVCNEAGGTLDDVLVYRFDDRWMLVVNAANREKLLAHFEQQRGDDDAVKIVDMTEQTAMVAAQGPKVMDMIGQYSREVPSLKKYHFAVKNLLVLKMTISRTGYTGEDGVEVIMPAKSAGMAIKLLLKDADREDAPVKPAGLGARDTLRLEAGMPLYGHELTEAIDPLSAGLKFAVNLDKDETGDEGPEIPSFVGQAALKQIAESGPEKTRVGLKLDGKRTPRQNMAVRRGERIVGEVTSGCLSPTLGYPIAMAYVPPDHAELGTTLKVDFGRKQVDAEVVKLPFYKPGG